jgi:type II secretion system protein H
MTGRFQFRGFTLMELLLVMVVIAIAAGIAAPAMRGFTRGRRLPNTAQEIVTMTRWCRVQAISDSTIYRLNLDPTESKIWVTKDDGTGRNFQPVVTDFVPGEYYLPEGITLTTDIPEASDDSGNNTGIFVTFEPGGRSDTGTISLHSDDATLDIQCLTAYGGFKILRAEGGE